MIKEQMSQNKKNNMNQIIYKKQFKDKILQKRKYNQLKVFHQKNLRLNLVIHKEVIKIQEVNHNEFIIK